MTVLLAALVSLTPAVAQASDAIDTRVTFTLADDDLAKGPEESSTGSPSLPNFAPGASNRLFFDDYERRDRGFENLTHLALYAHQPGFFEGLDTEAALVLRAEMLAKGDVKLTDDGSYINITKQLEASKLVITAFPVSANRFQLGYSYDISWGGSRIFKNAQAVPGLRLRWESDAAYAFLGTKATMSQVDKSDGTKELDTVWGVLGGAGLDVVDELRIEGGAGYFYRGTIDKQELRVLEDGAFKTAPWQAFGGSMQLSYHVGIPIGESIDFRLYKNDPMKRQSFFKTEDYNDDLSFLVQTEISVLGQTLQDPERPTSSKVQPALAADISGKVKSGKWRYNLLFVYKDLEYIRFNVPSLTPFVDLPAGIAAKPAWFISGGADYYVEALRYTPGIILGVQRPANLTTSVDAGNNPPASLGQQTLIVMSDTQITFLDPGEDVALVFASKHTGRWDLSEILSLVYELQLSYDNNRRTFQQDSNGIPVRVAEDPLILGMNVMLQSRF